MLESLEARLTPSATSQSYVDALYQSILHRPAMGGEDAGFITALDNGTQNRQQVALNIITSPESSGDLANAAFLQFHTMDNTTLSAAALQLENGANPPGDLLQLNIELASSNDFFTTQGGGTNAGFVNALYMDALGRPAAADPSSQAFIDGLNNGSLTQTQVATDVLKSPEYQQDVVNADYLQFLGRPAFGDPGAAGFEQELANGVTQQTVASQIAGSPEFLADVTQSPTGPTGPTGATGPTGPTGLRARR